MECDLLELLVMPNETWTYSHTQLALWKLCKRRYYMRYVLGRKEPTTANMAAGTWLAQEPIETYYQGRTFDDIAWQSIWANFLAEFGGTDDYDDPIFTLDLAKRILAAYKASPVQGKVVEIEKRYVKEFAGGYQYVSIPDLVVEREQGRIAFDLKLKTFNQTKAGDTFWLKPELSPFDDQGVGQAVCSGSRAFGQIQFWVGKRDGVVHGPFYVEHQLGGTMAQEWMDETKAEIEDIYAYTGAYKTLPFPKNDQACHAFGRPCSWLANCKFGFEVKA